MTRLRPARDDGYGYISRVDGDARLLDPRLQEEYFAQTCAQYGLETQLEYDLASDLGSLAIGSPSTQSSTAAADKSGCLGAFRKLREVIISSNRRDDFAIRVFEVSSEHALRCDHAESYLPALRYLLFDLYSSNTADTSHRESCHALLLAEAYLLHLLCVLDDAAAYLRDRARLTKHMAMPLGTTSERVLQALVRNNYALWQRTRRRAPPLLRILMDPAGLRMRQTYLDRIGVAYMQVPSTALDLNREELVKEAGKRGWTVQGDIVVIKKPRAPVTKPLAAVAH